jgi:predicted nucleic-acid-binding protein
MIGIDTNVLVRVLVEDDPRQAKRARAFLQTHCSPGQPGHINHIVICELAWTLDRSYGFEHAEIADAIEALMADPALRFQDRGQLASALQVSRDSALGLADALVREINLAAGCSSTVTLDAKAGRAAGFTLVR